MPHPEQVIRTGQIKMLQSRREYRCVKCEHRFTLTADLEQRHQMPLPDECPSNNAKPCRGSKFEFVEGTEVCKDYQEVRIQEQIHRLTVGSIPRSITLILQVRGRGRVRVRLRLRVGVRGRGRVGVWASRHLRSGQARP